MTTGIDHVHSSESGTHRQYLRSIRGNFSSRMAQANRSNCGLIFVFLGRYIAPQFASEGLHHDVFDGFA